MTCPDLNSDGGIVNQGLQAYRSFLAEKTVDLPISGVDILPQQIPSGMFQFQSDLTKWSLRKGRAALFADTGLGKTIMQLTWAQAIGRTLIVAPLAVSKQTIAEAGKWGIGPIAYAKSQKDSPPEGITITNYERAYKFEASQFDAVVLDESSILKSYDGKTRTALIRQFAETHYRLCCTATPAPNDISEIANHAEFLGVMTRAEMLAAYFVHDDQGWRLKGHASEAFYRWMSTWSMSIKKPSDLGYSDNGYDLPPLNIESHIVPTGYAPAGMLFAAKLKGIQERSAVRKDTVAERVKVAAELILSEPTEQWIAWCGLNNESEMLAASLGDKCAHVYGSQDADEKENCLSRFSLGAVPWLVTKPSIAGFGMNFQNCCRMVFVGVGDSYETYYQAIRRCWRFGQQNPVDVHVVLSEPEAEVYQNVLRKERDAENMSSRLVQNLAEFEKEEIGIQPRNEVYMTDEAEGDGWRLLLGDSCERIQELDTHSVDLSVFSPPFSSLYTYSPSSRDIGNCKSAQEFWKHFGFVAEGLLAAMKPGRNVCVHVSQIPLMKAKDGVIGVNDFRGATIRMFQSYGFIYHGEVCIDKDPQAQAIRTHSKGLLFAQLKRDAAWLRPALADYIVVFRTPGENRVPVAPDIDNETWIQWARPIWYGIKESDTLSVLEARSEKDERHICPLQLGTIERCIRLWSNKGETVFSPFAGIGSEGYQAMLLDRRFVGIELKPEYFRVAVRNILEAERKSKAERLF
jgi:DNA modification methylase/superfamily II DNA or RNA helicase